jgi:opacity protein-like surface antigen
MNDNSSYIELIYLMIDGEASEVERQTLFNALNENPELQTEFQNAITLNNAGYAYAATTEVPKHLTGSLFAKAGLAYSGASAINPAIETIQKASVLSKAGYFAASKYGFGILGLILGGIIAFLLFDDIYSGSPAEQDRVEITLMGSKTKVDDNKENYASNIIDTNKTANRNNNGQPKQIVRNESDSKEYTQSINDNEQSEKATETKDRRHLSINQNRDHHSFENKIFNHSKDFSIIDQGLDYSPLTTHSQLSSDNNFALELNSSSFWNLPKETIYPQEIAKLYNMNIFLYYKLNRQLSIGIGARQETFYVKYNTIDEYSREYIYEQQPNLTNFELAVRYHPFDMAILDPYVQFNTGGSYYGYTLRAGIGSEIKVYENISFTLFLEYATLRFKHKDFWNDASKVGINYGINYKF